jgi:hypothetical protein
MGIQRYRSSDGLPGWVVFLVAVAIGLGGYYVWLGVQDYIRAGGLGITEATQRAELIASATQQRAATFTAIAPSVMGTLPPTPTAVPPCQDFRVTAGVAIVRDRPTTAAGIVSQLPAGTVVCVIGRASADDQWYLIDTNPRTRRLDEGYMRQDVIEPVNPTPTPSRTVTRPPTVTPLPTTPAPPTETPTASLTPSAPPSVTPSPTHTLPPVLVISVTP